MRNLQLKKESFHPLVQLCLEILLNDISSIITLAGSHLYSHIWSHPSLANPLKNSSSFFTLKQPKMKELRVVSLGLYYISELMIQSDTELTGNILILSDP